MRSRKGSRGRCWKKFMRVWEDWLDTGVLCVGGGGGGS
jgi:hypothetical protein